MHKPLSELCYELARHAASANHETLAYILKMAASEALLCGIDAPAPTCQLAGIWDWDICNDISHLDATGADTFGVDPQQAAKGLPSAVYMKRVHPEDLPAIETAIQNAIQTGGRFAHQYRVLYGDKIKWIAAEGHVTLDASGRPLRFPGVLFDITQMVAEQQLHEKPLSLN